MTITFGMEDYNRVHARGTPYIFNAEFYTMLETIDKKITPLFPEKVQDSRSGVGGGGRILDTRKRTPDGAAENWSSLKPKFKTTGTLAVVVDGVDKWIQDIRVCINKMSLKNYDNQKTAILELLDKCNNDDDKSNEEKFKKIADFIFSVASSNIFFASIYASLFKVLMEKYTVFNDLLREYLNNYVNSVNKLKYADPDVDYDAYCQYNKENDMRKANAVFIIQLVKQKALPVMRVLSIITSFQDLTTLYIDEEERVHEVEEIAEILYLFLKGGKEVFQECSGEFIWKFVIIKNIEKIVKFKKGDKKSLSSRAIFKYMDIANGSK